LSGLAIFLPPAKKMRINGIEFTAEKIVDNAVESIRIKKIPLPTDDKDMAN